MNHALMATRTVFMPTIGQTSSMRVEDDQEHAGDRVEHPEPEHARLQQGVDEQRTAAPSEDVEPVVSEPGHGGRLSPAVTTVGIVDQRTTISRMTFALDFSVEALPM